MSWDNDNKMLWVAKEAMQEREKQLLDEMLKEIQRRLDILFTEKHIDQTANLMNILQMTELLHERMILQQENRT